jgi:hypothetical protein
MVNHMLVKRIVEEKKKKKNTNIPAQSQIYTGPLLVPGARLQEDTITANLQYVTTGTSSGGGSLTNVMSLAINGFQDYTSFTNAYDEWRCLKAICRWVPSAQDGVLGSTVAAGLFSYSPLVMVVDRDSSSALISYQTGCDYTSAEFKSINQDFLVTFQMSGSEDGGFVTTPSAASAYFKTYAIGLTGTQIYGYWWVRALFQFRGRA